MEDQGRRLPFCKPIPEKLRRAAVYGAGSLLIIGLISSVKAGGWPFSFVDARAYATGISAWLAGGDPYAHRPFMNFLYPPVFLLVCSTFAKAFSLPLLKGIYVGLHLMAALLLPWILYRYYLRASSWTAAHFYGFFFLAPGMLGLAALDTGNIAIICYTTALAAGIRGIQRNRWIAFYLVVFSCAAIKITFLPMLLLPLLCGSGQIIGVLICSGSALAGLEAQAWLTPDLYRRFEEMASRQSLELGDVGKGLLGILFHVAHKTNNRSLTVPILGYIVVAACVVVCLAVIKGRRPGIPCTSWPAIVLVAVLFVMPRVNYYDLCVGFPLAFCLITRQMRRIRAILLYLAMFIPSLALLIRLRDSALNGGFEALVILGMLTVVFARLLNKGEAMLNGYDPSSVTA